MIKLPARLLPSCCACLALALAASAGEEKPRLISGPRAAASGNGAKISFALNVASDVEVAILDAKGRVIRHLAAGVLGHKAPAPLQKGLKQKLTWDGKDDLGRAAAGGPFRVRVSVGMKPEFEKIIGGNPASVARVNCLAVGAGGNLYVGHAFADLHPGDSNSAIMIFDRKGNYVRQLLPYPANLPEKKLGRLRRVNVDGKKQPYVYQGETRNLYPCVGELPPQRGTVLADGTLLFLGLDEVGTYNNKGNKGRYVLLAVNADGSVPQGGPMRIGIAPRGMAAGPDGKLYGIVGSNVAQIDWQAGKATTIIAGKSGPKAPRHRKGRKPPPPPKIDESEPLVGAASVAVGAGGDLYVAEARGVVVFDKARKRLGLLKAPGATLVSVHPKTGAVYVLKGSWRTGCSLHKYNSWKDASPAASFSQKGMGWLIMAADFSADKPVLWLGCGSNWARERLLRLVDEGGKFSGPTGISSFPGNSGETAGPRTRYNMPTGGAPMGMALDRRRRILYVNKRSYDLKSGKWGCGSIQADGGKGGVGSFGLDGNFYSQHYSTTLWRFDADFKPLNFPATEAFRKQRLAAEKKMTPAEIKKQRIKSEGISLNAVYHQHELGLRRNGITADAKGVIYAAVPIPRSKRNALEKANKRPYQLWKIAPDGKVLSEEFIGCQLPGIYSPRVDYAGNVYVALSIRPKGVRAPNGLGKQWAKPQQGYGKHGEDIDWYPLMYGCIVKFGPDGGKVRLTAKGPEYEYAPPGKFVRSTRLEGAKWAFFGASPLVSWRMPAPNCCLCESPRFDVDGWGRSFFPDACRFRVGVLDTAGNLITWIGAYGNLDSAGPRSRIPKPDIPFAWPYLVFAEDGHVYVGDRLNRRVVAVKLSYNQSKTCAVK